MQPFNLGAAFYLLRRIATGAIGSVLLLLLFVPGASAQTQTPSPALLVLEKGDNMLAIVDPATFKIVSRVPAGPDPHEIVTSPDGKLAYISNYGGLDSSLNTITVVDVAAQKQLAPIQLGALHSPHGLWYAGGKLYFTAETNKAIGRYDPATKTVDWVLGTGQDRTHMVIADETQDRLFTSNANSGTISIIQRVELPSPGPPPGAPAGAAPPPGGQGGPRKTWNITNVPSGRGCEGFDVSPDGTQIWSANAEDNTVTVIDVATKKATLTFPVQVPHANRLKFTPDGKRVLITGLGAFSNSAASGQAPPSLEIYDTTTHKVVSSHAFGGGAAGILILADGSRAYIAVSGKNQVVSLDLKNPNSIATLSTGKGPDGLAWASATGGH